MDQIEVTRSSARVRVSRRLAIWGFLLPIAASLAAGCSQVSPPRVHPPSISASEAGVQAVEQYDTNKDEIIQQEELQHAPSLRMASKRLDLDGDGGISADEVAARIEAWQASNVGRMSASCVVLLNGRPLADAHVNFEPERFLGGDIPSSAGTSNEAGIAILSVQESSDHVPGVPCGLYLVRISKVERGKEIIPARYNTQTTLGEEVAMDAASVKSGMVRFELTSP